MKLNVQANFLRPKMDWARFAGLVQTDGCITFQIEANGQFRPIIIISQSDKPQDWVNYVVDFVRAEGITVRVEGGTGGRSTNIKIERIQNVQNVITKIDSLAENDRPILMDSKLRDFLLLKKAFSLNLLKNSSFNNQGIKAKKELIDLKKLYERFREDTPKPLTRLTYEGRLGLVTKKESEDPNTKTVSDGAAEQYLKDIEEEVKSYNLQLLTDIKSKQFIVTQNIGNFIAGCFDGDGSFQINTYTNAAKDRVPFEFKPRLTYTNKLDKSLPNDIYDLISYAFYRSYAQVVSVGGGKNADRYQLEDRKILTTSVKQFFTKYPISVRRRSVRNDLMQKALELVPDQHKKYAKAIELLDIVYDNPDFFNMKNRAKTKEEYLAIIDNYFKK